jgi:hypothetical protein
MKIGVRDQGPVFRDGCFSHPGHIFILGCVRKDMRVYMQKKSGVRIQNPEVRIHMIIQSEAFWLLATGFWILFHPWLCPQGHEGLYENSNQH